jgi:hypothetical protein
MEKKTYFTPQIEFIQLDREISLVLESAPPLGPDEFSHLKTDCLSNNPAGLA